MKKKRFTLGIGHFSVTFRLFLATLAVNGRLVPCLEKIIFAFFESTFTSYFLQLMYPGMCHLSAQWGGPGREVSQKEAKSPFPFSHTRALRGRDERGKKAKAWPGAVADFCHISSTRPTGLQWVRKWPYIYLLPLCKGKLRDFKAADKKLWSYFTLLINPRPVSAPSYDIFQMWVLLSN